MLEPAEYVAFPTIEYVPLTTGQLIEVLKLARGKIYRRKNWTQKVHAQNKDGNLLTLPDLNAYYRGQRPDCKPVCFCALGAVYAAVWEYSKKHPELNALNVYYDTRTAFSTNTNEIRKGKGIAIINDETNHKTVIKLFNTAIKALTQTQTESQSNA